MLAFSLDTCRRWSYVIFILKSHENRVNVCFLTLDLKLTRILDYMDLIISVVIINGVKLSS
jgi:hypothetical protein